MSKIVFDNLKEHSTITNITNEQNLIQWLKNKFSNDKVNDEDNLNNFWSLCQERLKEEQDSYTSLHVSASSLCFLYDGREPENKGNITLLLSSFKQNTKQTTANDIENNQELFNEFSNNPEEFPNYLKQKLEKYWTSVTSQPST